jgi:hypothetical protein
MPANVAKPISSDLDLIWGAKAIGIVLNLDERQAFYQLEAGRIPGARKWGRKWSAPSLSPKRTMNASPIHHAGRRG